jgi:hypothetical protein
MLHRVPALVCRNSGGGYAATLIYIRAEVNRLGQRVVVIAEKTLPHRNFHVADAIMAEHRRRSFCAAHPGAQAYLAVLLKFTLEPVANNETDDRGTNDYYPIKHVHIFRILVNECFLQAKGKQPFGKFGCGY